MMKVHRTLTELPLLLTLILAITQWRQITLRAAAQDTPRVVPAPISIHPPAPALQGSATGEIKPFKLLRRSLKASVLAHPVPHVSLLFILGDKRTKVTVQLPPAARKLLVECWKAELAYYYNRAFEPSGLDKRIEDKYALGGVNSTVLSDLETVTIEAPTGQRKISWDEAGDLVRFMAEAAQKVIAQAKESQSPKPVA